MVHPHHFLGGRLGHGISSGYFCLFKWVILNASKFSPLPIFCEAVTKSLEFISLNLASSSLILSSLPLATGSLPSSMAPPYRNPQSWCHLSAQFSSLATYDLQFLSSATTEMSYLFPLVTSTSLSAIYIITTDYKI